jgi:heme/copper-type cytochrome/quinol oxidase subunit 2
VTWNRWSSPSIRAMVVVVVVVIVLVVAVLIMGAAPMVRRTADAREIEMKAKMPGSMDVDVNRLFKRPRDEGDLL